ncbi:MAG: N-acetyl-gamma-glutamyl-phosphate reductase, partial [Methanomicrobiales archaeon]|nr:N-acetyl-gamma-glutamyl-phosphate reductase [Methanomicrobiales archaeon]
ADTIEADFVFLAVPHTAAMQHVPRLLERGITTLDLSADYRLPKDVYEKTYGVRHTAYLPAPYGLPELHREEIRNAKFVACPGCFPTGATLAAAPLAGRARAVVFDSKTGVSGAGNSPSEVTHYPNIGDSVVPYKWTAHRHLAEMKMELGKLGMKSGCYFTPHLAPMNRGILTTAHILTDEPVPQEEVMKMYEEFYRGEYFVRLQKPSLAAVRGTNFCDIACESSEGRVVVVSAIDNLVKGASGQAIQNMNLMCGFKENDGLTGIGLLP